MNFVQPKVEWWEKKSPYQQIAEVSRICYRSTPSEPDRDMSPEQKEKFIEERDAKMCERLWESGHRSMYRHGTVYYYIKNQSKLPSWIWNFMAASPYIDYTTKDKHIWIVTNLQFFYEYDKIVRHLDNYIVTEEKYIEEAIKYGCNTALTLLRMTMVVTTQISTSRELNRTSPNSISEQSTRYVNMRKKGGVQVCLPHWWKKPKAKSSWKAKSKSFLQKLAFSSACRFSEWMYLLLVRTGMKPQDARGVLPLDTYTVVAYTYSISEWKHIIDLRFHGTTGAPHPNAKLVCRQIRDIITERMANYIPNFNI